MGVREINKNIFYFEYFYSFIGFIYRDHLEKLRLSFVKASLDNFFDNSNFLWYLNFFTKTFSKKSKYIKLYNLCKNTNKHPCVIYMKRFFMCLLALL